MTAHLRLVKPRNKTGQFRDGPPIPSCEPGNISPRRKSRS